MHETALSYLWRFLSYRPDIGIWPGHLQRKEDEKNELDIKREKVEGNDKMGRLSGENNLKKNVSSFQHVAQTSSGAEKLLAFLDLEYRGLLPSKAFDLANP